MALPVSDVPVTLGASGRCPAWYSTMPLASLALPFPEVSNVTASAPASSTATTAVTVTTVRRLALNTSGALTAVASRGGRPPYPPMSGRSGPDRKTRDRIRPPPAGPELRGDSGPRTPTGGSTRSIVPYPGQQRHGGAALRRKRR